MFYLDRGNSCLSKSSCENVDVNPASAATPPKHNMSIVGDILLVQHRSVGYHAAHLTNVTQVKVLPGDMLAWLSSKSMGKIAGTGETPTVQGHVFKGIVNGTGKQQKLGPGVQSLAFNMTFALRARIVPLSSFSVTFHLDKIAIHPVMLTLWDSFGNTEVSGQEVVQQEAISGLSLNLPEFALVGAVTFGLTITNGTNVTYIWHFGENKNKEIFKETSLTHILTSSGPHNVSVTASNDVTVAQSECFGWPYLLYAVENLTISFLAPVMVNKNSTIVISLAKGSLVDMNISFGDGSLEFNISKIDVKDSFVVSINHSYGIAGVFTVKALAKNALSNARAQRNITVQFPVSGLTISGPQGVQSSHEDLKINVTVTEGTDIQYKVTLSCNSMTNKTASGNFSMVVFPKSLLKPGMALLKVTAFNLVSSTESVRNILIETPITGTLFSLTSGPAGAIETRKATKFKFYYRTGSNISLTFWMSIAAGSKTIQPYPENVYWWIIGFQYADPGVYTARVNYSNVLGYVVLDTPVIVQEPVRRIRVLTDRFIPLPSGIVDVFVKQNGTLATNATVNCSWDDGSPSEILDLTNNFNVSHRCLELMFVVLHNIIHYNSILIYAKIRVT